MKKIMNAMLVALLAVMVISCGGDGTVGEAELTAHDFALGVFNNTLMVYQEERPALKESEPDAVKRIDNGFLAVNTALDLWYKAIEARENTTDAESSYIKEWTRLIIDLANNGIEAAP